MPFTALNRIELAAEEAIVNIIRHAYADQIGVITLCCSHSQERSITITLRDNGTAFDPSSHPKIRGRGLHLMHASADIIEYRREGTANVLTMLFDN